MAENAAFTRRGEGSSPSEPTNASSSRGRTPDFESVVAWFESTAGNRLRAMGFATKGLWRSGLRGRLKPGRFWFDSREARSSVLVQGVIVQREDSGLAHR